MSETQKRPISADFLTKMQAILGDEFDAFRATYSQDPHIGLRVNTLKISPEEFTSFNTFSLAGADQFGRRIIYSMCAFAHEENDAVIGRYLSNHPNFTLT